MSITTAGRLAAPIAQQYKTSEYLFGKALDGVTESDLYRRPTAVTNHMLWIAGHIADTRVLSLRALHATFDLPWGDCLQRGCEVRADSEYPSIAKIRDIFRAEGTRLAELLASVPDERACAARYRRRRAASADIAGRNYAGRLARGISPGSAWLRTQGAWIFSVGGVRSCFVRQLQERRKTMLKNIDRILGVLLVLASLGHTFGTLKLLPAWGGMWVWSLGAALAGLLLGALNIVRAGRPGDAAIAILTTGGTFCWILVALAFGKSIGNLLDPRVVGHAVISSALVIFGLVTLSRVSAARPEIAIGRR